MPIGAQMKLLNAAREVLLGDARSALPGGGTPKPAFPQAAKPAHPLPRSTPEAEGLSSAHLEGFFRALAASRQAAPHAAMVVKNGSVVAEGYWAPYRPGVWHVTHSLSKSFVGAAVGLAIEECLFGLDDAVAEFFPEQLGLLAGRKYKGITVRHLLSMTSGISFNEISAAVENDWLRGIFSAPLAFEPGSRFVYNSLNSYLLAALVKKTSGEGVLDYLRPRLLEPMGFGPVAWESSAGGIEKGGWGMYVTLEDAAKFGQLHLNGGRWMVEGELRQLLPAEWVRQATQEQSAGDERDAYGYQMWVDPKHECFVMNGLFGQYILGCPRLGLVIAMHAGSNRLFTDSPAYRLMEEYFLSGAAALGARAPSPVAAGHLRSTLKALTFYEAPPQTPRLPRHVEGQSRRARWNPLRRPAPDFAGFDAYCGTTWRFGRNRAGLLPVIAAVMDNNFSGGVQALRLERREDELTLLWEENEDTACLPVGLGRWAEGVLRCGGESFLTGAAARLAHDEMGDEVLVIQLCLLEHSSSRVLKLRLVEDGQLRLCMDEQPQFSHAVEKMLMQEDETAKEGKGRSKVLNELVFNNELLHANVLQLCRPDLTGTPM